MDSTYCFHPKDDSIRIPEGFLEHSDMSSEVMFVVRTISRNNLRYGKVQV